MDTNGFFAQKISSLKALGVMATCPLMGSQQASPATEEGQEGGTREVLVLPSKRGLTPLLSQTPQRGFSWLMVLLLGEGDTTGAAVSLGWLGAGFGQEGGA